jgi:DNA repair protein RadA/Sms
VGLSLSNQDIFLNVVGGLKIGEPAADLATAVAVGSSFRDRPVDPTTVVIGEIGLAGEVRTVAHLERRITEAAKIGFRRAVIPNGPASNRLKHLGLDLFPVRSVRDALDAALLE